MTILAPKGSNLVAKKNSLVSKRMQQKISKNHQIKATPKGTIKQAQTQQVQARRKLTGTINYSEESSWVAGAKAGAGGASTRGFPQYSANSTGSQK